MLFCNLFFVKSRLTVLIFLNVFFLMSCANIERVGNYGLEEQKNSEKQSEESLPYRSSASDKNVSPAIKALMDQAEVQELSGQLEAASSTIERALRISPQTPQLHLFLAKLHFKQDQVHSALQLALKGQSLLASIKDNNSLANGFWQLIGDCYTRLGNTSKASKAYSYL